MKLDLIDSWDRLWLQLQDAKKQVVLLERQQEELRQKLDASGTPDWRSQWFQRMSRGSP